ncbi:MAG: methyltransferase domain-containing protein [Bacteroidota bacterium]
MEREGYLCGNCGASSRMRAVIHLLGKVLGEEGPTLFEWPSDKSVSILESSARGPYPMMLADKFDYVPTEYDPEKIRAADNAMKYADFQDLKFPDNSFDLVIASEVFEHVRDDIKGYREVLRVLKPGGALLLTVPYDHEMEQTRKRVDTSGEEDVHLMEPEYHGGGGHTLAYRNYGRDLMNVLRDAGFAVCHYDLQNLSLGITAQHAFVGRKGEYSEVRERYGAEASVSSLGPLLPFRLFLLLKYNMTGLLSFLKKLTGKQ